MSSRWKKNKRNKNDRKGRMRASDWISLSGLSLKDVQQGAEIALQQSCCQVSGEIFVRPITGRFKGLPEEKLNRMLDEMAEVFSRAGHAPVLDRSQPLWMQVEFLDNLIEFELNPPCGCESELKKKMRSA